MPRPTPRQRAVLEAMSAGALVRLDGADWFLDNGRGNVDRRTIWSLYRHKWVKRTGYEHDAPLVITEAGRRAVARSDGGV